MAGTVVNAFSVRVIEHIEFSEKSGRTYSASVVCKVGDYILHYRCRNDGMWSVVHEDGEDRLDGTDLAHAVSTTASKHKDATGGTE